MDLKAKILRKKREKSDKRSISIKFDVAVVFKNISKLRGKLMNRNKKS